MPRNVRIDRGWIWPGMVFFVLGVLLATFAADAPWLVGSIRLYAPVVQGVGLFLAWRYRRSRVAAVLIGLFMMDVLLRPSTLVPGVGSVWDSSGVLFLFLMAVVAAMKDRGVLSPRGLIQSAVIPAGLAGGLMLWAVRPEFLGWTWQRFLPWNLSGPLGVSDAVLSVGTVALLLTGGLALWRGHRLDLGFFWITLMVPLALRSGADSVGSTVYLTMAGLILIINVIEKSYTLALHDNLTGLPGRRALRRQVRRLGASYALAVVSVDNYGALHDRYGRDAADRVIKKVANHMDRIHRRGHGSVHAFRYASDQFTLLFSGKGRNEVVGNLETLRAEIEDFRFLIHPRASRNGTGKDGAPRHKSLGWSLTVSIGVTERGEKKGWAATYWAVTRAARRALARGQKAGGNTVAK